MAEPTDPVADATKSVEELELEIKELGEAPSGAAEQTEYYKKKAEMAEQVLARAKKAEAKLKEQKPPEPAKPADPPKPADPQAPKEQVDVDERILISQGMEEELMKDLKKVAKLNNVSLIEAQKDPVFVVIKEQFEKKKKSEDASVGAGRGASAPKPKETAATPNLSRDKHKELAKAALKGK